MLNLEGEKSLTEELRCLLMGGYEDNAGVVQSTQLNRGVEGLELAGEEVFEDKEDGDEGLYKWLKNSSLPFSNFEPG